MLTGLLIAVLLAALPVAVWMDLTNLAEAALRRQANDLNSVISSVRSYYASNVVGRVLAHPGTTQVVHNYETIPGAIPIPATLSLELDKVISEQQRNINYRFVSDFPFKNRTPHQLDAFEKASLQSLRDNPDQKIVDAASSMFSDSVRLIAPIIMGPACVSCHNAHPESPKHDWKVGDVRGVQEVAITQPIAANIFSFKYLLAYFAVAAISGVAFVGMQRRQARQIRGHEPGIGSEQRLSRGALAENLALYLAAGLQEHFQRTEGRHNPYRKEEIDDFFSDIQNFIATRSFHTQSLMCSTAARQAKSSLSG